MKFLCHAGPWSDKYLSTVINEIDNNNTCVLLSAHKGVDSSGLISLYYENLKRNKNVFFSGTEIDNDIIIRCRLLRSLSKEDALLHLNSMRYAVSEVFDKIKPDIVLSETIDSYIMDLLYFESIKRKIPFIGLVTVFLNGYFRISARGEYNFVRTPEEKEVIKALEILENKNYLPNFVQKDKKSPNKVILTKWFRNLIKIPYFSAKRIYTGDFYNYHYWQSVIISKQWSHLFPKLEIGSEDWKDVVVKVDKPVVFVPLQMIPEATVDYWCDSVDVIDYNETLLAFISKHNEMHFLIKEHPNVIGYRNPKLYKQLIEFDNVTICPTQINSNYLHEYYTTVLVWTGTVGFEAALRGKPVLCFSHPYYFPEGSYFKRVDLNTNTEEILEYISSKSSTLNYQEKFKLVSHLLSSVDVGSLVVDGSWSQQSQVDISKVKTLAKSLNRYISSRIFND